jgi:hypothetical protein
MARATTDFYSRSVVRVLSGMPARRPDHCREQHMFADGLVFINEFLSPEPRTKVLRERKKFILQKNSVFSFYKFSTCCLKKTQDAFKIPLWDLNIILT